MHPSKSGWYPRAGCAASGARQRAVLHGNPEPKGKRESEGIVLRAAEGKKKRKCSENGGCQSSTCSGETSNSRQNEHSIRGREAWVDGPKYFVQEKVEPHGRIAQGLSDLCWASSDF